MTMFLAPYTAIADIDGSPLDAGFIYFGEFGKNPESSPVSVFWDADFTIPAAQPIRTRNGYPVRNGSPAKIYLREPMHSISVKNRNGSTIFVDVSGAGLVSTLLVRPSGVTVEQTFNDIDESLEEKQQQINKKAPTEYVNEQLALKAPQSTTYTKTEVDSALDQKASKVDTYTKAEVDTTFSSFAGGRKAYTTLALAVASQSTLPADTVIDVTNDPTASNNGTYQWNGTTLTKSDYDPALISRRYTDEKTLIVEKNAMEFTDNKFNQLFILDFHSEEGFSSIVIDQNNNIVLAIKDNKLVTANADEFIRDFHNENFKVTYISVDKNFNILNGGSSGASTGLDTSDLQNFAFHPTTLKAGDVYSDFGVLRDQKEWNGDLYTTDVSEIVLNHQAVYAFYDQLVNQNPTRFAMEVIGYDALDNEIRQYTYTPRALISVDDGSSDSAWDAEAIAPPKLVVLTGVHGGTEKEAILQLMIFMSEIFNRYTEIEEAALLRQAQLVIIPCSTPSAIDLGTRQNHAGVDVNRNARSGFQGAGGTALSQPECALAVDLPNRHPDASCFIDFHNYHMSGMTAWFATHGLGNSLDVIRKVAYELNIMTPARFPFLASRAVRLGRNANGTIARDWQLISGKKGYLIETAIDEGVYPKFELRQHGLTVLRKSLSAIYLSEFEV